MGNFANIEKKEMNFLNEEKEKEKKTLKKEFTLRTLLLLTKIKNENEQTELKNLLQTNSYLHLWNFI